MGIKSFLAKFKDKNYLKKSIIAASVTAACLAMQTMVIVFLKHFPLWSRIISLLLLTVINVITVLFYYTKKKSLFRLCITAIVALTFFLAVFIILDASGIMEILTSDEENKKQVLRELISKAGKWQYAVFYIMTVLQVIIVPIPSIVSDSVATQLFGAPVAFILSAAGVITGSIAAYFLGRTFGARLVYWIMGKENTDKYIELLKEKGKPAFILMIAFPFFPDDIVCMTAGIIKIPVWFFIIVTAIARPISSATNCFLASGDLIPFAGWGIPVWIAIFVIMCGLFYLATRYTMKKPAPLNKRKIFFPPPLLRETATDKQADKEIPALITNPDIVNDKLLFEKLKRNTRALNDNHDKDK